VRTEKADDESKESKSTREPLFRTARQNRIFQDVVDQIQDAIIDGRLQTGDKLPAERELKDLLKTSRSTLREALRVLEHKGLIEIKLGVGGGAIVRSVSADQVTESLGLLIRSQKVSLNHLAEFRKGLEGDVVATASRRARRSHIARLNKLLDRAKGCVERADMANFLLADKNIHLAFAEITENPLYISILKMIHDNINRYYERFLPMKEPEMAENYRDLEGIVHAIESGDAELSRSLVQSHVRRFNGYMKAQEKLDQESSG
jgi:DNA-binding FadR family transcriptional regulator